MKISIFCNGKEYFSASRASDITGYTSDYIGQLCRAGKLEGDLVGRTWYVDLEALQIHKKVRQLGRPSHRPKKVHNDENLEAAFKPDAVTSKVLLREEISTTFLPQLTKSKRSDLSLHSSNLFYNFSLSSLALVVALVMAGGMLNLSSPNILKNIEVGSEKISQVNLSDFAVVDIKQLSNTLTATVSLSDFIADSWRKITGVFTELFADNEEELLPAYKPTFTVEKNSEETVRQTVVTSSTSSYNFGNIKAEILEELELYINTRYLSSTPSNQVIYQSGPTLNTVELRGDIFASDTQPAIRQQSDKDSARNALSIASVLDGGEFINASITTSTGSFSTLSGTTFTFTNATGTSLYLSGNAAIDGNLNVGSNTVTLGQLISTRVPTLAHVFAPSWPSGTSNASDATIYINPASAAPDTNIFAAAVNGQVKFLVDAEGDVYANNMILSGSTSAGETNIAGNLSVQDNSTFGDASTDITTFNSQLQALASTTLQNFTFTSATGTSATTTNLYAQIFNSQFSIFNEATSTSLYATTGTFTNLFSNTSNLTESGNLFWTDNRFDARLSATTTLPNLTTLLSLTDTITTNATTTNSTSTNFYSSSLTAGNSTTTNLAVSGSSQLGTIISGLWNGTAIGDSYLTKSGDWTGTFDSQEGTYYLARANHTGTQLASTISDFAAAADLRINATTTLGTLTTLLNLTDTITTRATTTNATSTNFFSTTASSTNLFSSLARIGGNAFNVTASGNIGIGTTNPDSLIHIYGIGDTTASPKLRLDNSGSANGQFYIQSYRDGAASDLRIGESSTDFITIIGDGAGGVTTNRGFVGIGTTSPSSLLYVSSLTDHALITTDSAVNKESGLTLKEAGSNKWEIYKMSSAGDELNFYSYDGSRSVLTMLSSGNVGVGTTSPQQKLVVQAHTDALALSIAGRSTGQEEGWFRFYRNNGTTMQGGIYGSNNVGLTLSGPSATADLNIIAGGNVGIGTTNPVHQLDISSDKLNGQVIARAYGSGYWSQSGLSSFTAASVNDGHWSSTAFHTDSAGVGSYLQLDLGSGNAKAFAGVKIGTSTTKPQAVWDVEYSSNGTVWSKALVGIDVNKITIANSAHGAGSFTWGPVGQYRYWRLYKTSAAGGGGYHSEVQFYEVEDAPTLFTLPGSVGIGTASPDFTLNLYRGDVSAYTPTAYNPNQLLDLEFNSGEGNYGFIHFRSNGAMENSFGVVQVGNQADFVWQAYNGSAYGERMRLTRSGYLGIGTTNPTAKFSVVQDLANNTMALFQHTGNSSNRFGIAIASGTYDNSGTNYHMHWQDGDTTDVGYVTSSGGTVSYGAFTANHDVSLPSFDNANGYDYGTLVCLEGNAYVNPDTLRGVKYNVVKCSEPYAKNVLGAYAGKYEDKANLHQVYVLGDGHILVNGENGNIKVGDPIVTSSSVGIGMRGTDSGLSIGIAQEEYTFSSPEERKLIAVQYGLSYVDPTIFADEEGSDFSLTFFFGKIWGAIVTKLADAANGIAKIVTEVIESKKSTTELLCVKKADGSEVCLSGEQLESLIANVGSGSTIIIENSTTSTSQDSTSSSNTSTTTESTTESNTASTTDPVVESSAAEETTPTPPDGSAGQATTEEPAAETVVEEPPSEPSP